eukprot:3163098-Pyramimonas_sp.AAC.1
MRTKGRNCGPAARTAGTWAKRAARPLARLVRFASFRSAMLSSSSSFGGLNWELTQHRLLLDALCTCLRSPAVPQNCVRQNGQAVPVTNVVWLIAD